MRVVRWPECDILESNLKKVDEFWIETSKGPIMAAFIFPFSELETLMNLRAEIAAKKKELSDIEAKIYRVSRKF